MNSNFRRRWLAVPGAIVVSFVFVQLVVGYSEPPACPTSCGGWSCVSTGSVDDPGGLTRTSDTICAGGGVNAPSLTNTTFISGQKAQTCNNNCGYFWTNYWPITYTATNWWEPPIPAIFPTNGTFSFTNKVRGVTSAQDCPSPTAITNAGTFTVTVHADTDADSLPDWWELQYFGNLVQGADDDPDGDGFTNMQEYQNGTDPNTLRFTVRLGCQHFNTTSVTGNFVMLAGVPAQAAVLLDSTNLQNSSWYGYNETFALTLGPADGVHEVTLGLKGHASNSVPVWVGTEVSLDRVAPTVTIVSPSATNLSQPMIQIRGYTMEPIRSVSCELTNELGIQTNLDALPRETKYATNGEATNFFQCFDVELTNGLNQITLRVEDYAGNVTTTNLNFFLEASTNPPVLTLNWPQNGAEFCKNTVTVHGFVDDISDAITLALVATNGTTNTFEGIVERSGKFWVEHVPLEGGTNLLSLTATDVWGNSATTNIAVLRSDFVLTMNPVPDSQLWQTKVRVSGTVGSPDHGVWVNGVKGTNHGDGTWSAGGVPMMPGGTAFFEIKAYAPGEEQPDGTHGN